MPIYEYRCDSCGEEFEKLVLAASEKPLCPQCNSSRVHKLMSACAFSVGNTFKSTAASNCASCAPSAASCSTCGVKR